MTRRLVLLVLVLPSLLLCACKQRGDRSVPELARQLRNRSAARRVEAAEALAGLGPGAARAVPDLIKALDDSDVRVRRRAAAALGKIGPSALPAFSALVRLEGIEESTAALCAIAASVKPAVFVDAIWRHTSSEHELANKVQGIIALRSMASRCPRTAAAIHPLIKKRAQAAIDRAAEAIKLPEAVKKLARAPVVALARTVGDPDSGVISIDGVEVATFKQVLASKDWRLEKLVQLLEQKKAAWKGAHPGKTFPGEVIVQADKDLDFQLIKRVMYSCGLAGYANVHFAVAATEEPT
jgi:HEAT repeat protein